MTTAKELFERLQNIHKPTKVVLTELDNIEVFIRKIGNIDFVQYQLIYSELLGNPEEFTVDAKAMELCTMLFCVEDGKGNLLFSAEDVHKLIELPAKAYVELANFAMKHSGMFEAVYQEQ